MTCLQGWLAVFVIECLLVSNKIECRRCAFISQLQFRPQLKNDWYGEVNRGTSLPAHGDMQIRAHANVSGEMHIKELRAYNLRYIATAGVSRQMILAVVTHKPRTA